MFKCFGCKYNNDCTKAIRIEMENCTEYCPLTNADRIRAMSDEALSHFFGSLADKVLRCPEAYWDMRRNCLTLTCQDCWLKWLREGERE